MSKKWFGGVNQNHGILLRFSGSSEKGDIISSSVDSVASSSIQRSVTGTVAAGDGSLLAHVVTSRYDRLVDMVVQVNMLSMEL